MNENLFTGKAQAYAEARPEYPETAMAYIRTLIPKNAVFADIGAGTGKFTVLPARSGYRVFAVEPNSDMREKLSAAVAMFPNVKIIDGTAEATTLPDASADVVTVAQALHWFNPELFRAECRRILRSSGLVVSIYNAISGQNSASHSQSSADAFFCTPIVAEFDNPTFYTREKWLLYMTSHSHNPRPSDPEYPAHMTEMNAIFDRESLDGVLKRDIVTRVYSEKIF